jgi:hypothetical protein
MPAKPTWFHKLDDVLQELRGLSAPYLDRRAVERLLGVGERRARELMMGVPCVQIGNAVAVERSAFIAKLDRVSRSPEWARETVRRERVENILADLRHAARARKVELPSVVQKTSREALQLSPEVHLRPGELTVHFDGAKDLATKLFELSQAMIRDWEYFEKHCS